VLKPLSMEASLIQNMSGKQPQELIGDFRSVLQQELLNRCRQNPAYSLRSFARFLDIEPSALSKLIRGKRSLTKKMFIRLAQQLGFGSKSIQTYSENYFKRPTHLRVVEESEEQILYKQLSADTFEFISDWYHYAILELIKIDGFQPNEKWVAQTLGISFGEASAAVSRLQRLGFLEINKRGKWISKESHLTIQKSPHTTAAQRKMQTQLLQKAQVALEQEPLAQRDQSTLTVAIDPKIMPEVSKKIKKFRHSLCRFVEEKSKKPKRVYNLNVSFYPVSKEIKK